MSKNFWELEREPDEMGGAFDFMAGAEVEANHQDDEGNWLTDTYYTVRLPHQCDYWEIVRSADKETAVLTMEKFIAEANAALDRLREAAPSQPPTSEASPQ